MNKQCIQPLPNIPMKPSKNNLRSLSKIKFTVFHIQELSFPNRGHLLVSEAPTSLSNIKIATRKRALHARMSHSTVCNTTISTKKTLRTPVKEVRKLHETPQACKGNAPVNMKK